MESTSKLEIALWREAITLISCPPSLKNGLHTIAELLVRHFAVDSCVVYLLDQRTEELVLWGVAGDPDGMHKRLRVGQGVAGLAAYQRRPIQVAHHGMHDPFTLAQRQQGTYQSMVAVPLMADGRLVGVFSVRQKAARHFSPQEMEILEQVVPALIFAVVKTAQTLQDLGRRTYELQALNELGQAMNSSLGLDEMLELIAARAAEALCAKGAVVRLMVEDGTLALATIVVEGEFNIDSQYEKRIAEFVAETGEPIIIDDARIRRDPEVVGSSMVCVPLVVEEKVVGTLSLFDKAALLGAVGTLFNVDDLNMLFALSSQIAAEIEEIRMTVRLQELVRTEKQQGEELRGLYNRSQALLQSISDGLLAIDQDGRVEEFNAVAMHLFGFGKQLAAHPHIDELVEDKPPLKEWLKRGDQFSNRVLTLKTATGRVAAMANLQPVLDLDVGEQATGAVLTFREMKEVGRLVNRVIGVQRTFSFADIIGQSGIIEKTKELARTAAGTSSNILIQGETGTGKEVFAQAIHNVSSFSEGPFLAVNCAAMPRDLIESELFGYVEGAFTGASKKGRLGKFELASGGTLFLDEIGDIPVDVQVKLLRVLQEKAMVRVGGDRTIPINCRLIAASNRNLLQAVAEHKFRRDLLYRLNVIAIELPPLRNRVEDIPLFIDKFIQIFTERNAKVVDGVDKSAMSRLLAYEWPGNVRELENAIEYAVAMVKGRMVGIDDLPVHLKHCLTAEKNHGETGTPTFEEARQDCETAIKQLYLEALRTEQGNIVAAAQLLGVSRATLYRRMKKYGLQRDVLKMRFEYQK